MKKKNIKEGYLEYNDGYTEDEILDMLLDKADELGIDEDAIGYEVVEMVRNMMAEDGLSIDEAIDKAFDGICNADREYRSDYIWEVLDDMIPCAEDYGLPEPEFDDAEKVAQYIIDNGATVHGAMYAVLPAYREAVDREESGVNENTIKINEGTIKKIVAESVKQIMEAKKLDEILTHKVQGTSTKYYPRRIF